MPDVDPPLADVVQESLAFLLALHAFSVVSADEHVVRLQSPTLVIEVVRDRGQVSVCAFPRDGGSARDGWAYTGMVGKASEHRLLEIAAERIVSEPSILLADPTFFAKVAAERRRSSAEWTAFYAGQGPQPKCAHHLP
jgi:hypothetical protein